MSIAVHVQVLLRLTIQKLLIRKLLLLLLLLGHGGSSVRVSGCVVGIVGHHVIRVGIVGLTSCLVVVSGHGRWNSGAHQ